MKKMPINIGTLFTDNIKISEWSLQDDSFVSSFHPADIYQLKVNNRNTKTK